MTPTHHSGGYRGGSGPDAPQIAIDIRFDRFRLENGLEVILYEDHKAPLVHVLVWYHVGSRNETAELTGFAHLFEHMMFQGSANVGKTEHFSHVQGVGGALNASTGQDRTNYFQTLPREYLELGLWLEADRMRSLKVTPQNYDNQRSVVAEERRQRYDNAPYGLWLLTLLEMIFEGSPYSWGPIGDMEQLAAAPIESVIAFHRRYYVPNNATLVIAGDFDPAEARRMVEEQFGDVEAGAPIEPPRIELSAIEGRRHRTIVAEVPLPAVYIAVQGATLSASDTRALDLLAMIMTRGRSSRLQRSLVFGSQIAQRAGAFNYDLEGAGMFTIFATAAEGTGAGEIEEGIWEVVEELQRDGVTRRELEGALNRIRTAFVTGLVRLQGVADALAHNSVLRGDPSLVNEMLAEYERVTSDDIRRVARQYLRRDASAVLYYLPTTTSSTKEAP